MNKRFAIAALLVSLVAAALYAQGTILINAAGATFPYPIYSKWFDVYHQKFPSIQINYASVGSGAGISQLMNGTAWWT
jgi:phosphate transport system substrate-binding protein